MTSSIMESFKEYISLYNDARKSGDNTTAVRIGRKIVQIADEQCVLPEVSVSYKEFYKKSADYVREFLADGQTVRRNGKQSGSGSEDKIAATDWFGADIPKLTMRDVAGLQNVKDEFTVNVFAPLSPKYSVIYKKYRREMGLQILLYGPPGTGKTHIVKCLAGQLGCKIAVVQIKDVMANLVGDGAKIISTIFEQARKYDKCIIFFDEIDAIAASRDDDESRHTKEQLTTLLTNMDGFTAGTKEGQIRIIVAATNRPWVLDSAVKRGGRFDTQIYVPLPDYDARIKLVSLALGKDVSVNNRLDVPCADDVTVEWLAEQFDGYAGADIKAAIRQMINRPLKREINYLSRTGKMSNDCITREDCDCIMSKYINSITDEMLIQFDAYAANMDLMEYLKVIPDKARRLVAEGKELPSYLKRYLRL